MQRATTPGMVWVYQDGWKSVTESKAAMMVRQASQVALRGRDAARAANARLGVLLLALRGHLNRTLNIKAGENATWNAKLEQLGLHKQTAWRVMEAAIRHADQQATKVCDAAILAELCAACWPQVFSGNPRKWTSERSAWLIERSRSRAAARLVKAGEGAGGGADNGLERQRVAAVRMVADLVNKAPLWAPVIERDLREMGLAQGEAAELAAAMAVVGRYAGRLGTREGRMSVGAGVRGARSA